jgi:hypothetical protein
MVQGVGCMVGYAAGSSVSGAGIRYGAEGHTTQISAYFHNTYLHIYISTHMYIDIEHLVANEHGSEYSRNMEYESNRSNLI